MSARPCSHGEPGGIYGGCAGCIKDLYSEGLAVGLRLGGDKGWAEGLEAAAKVAEDCHCAAINDSWAAAQKAIAAAIRRLRRGGA